MQNIRKFSVNYCDLETMICNVSFMLRLIAVNIDVRSPKPPAVFHLTTSTFIGIYYYIYVISVTWFVYARPSEERDFKKVVVVLSLGFTSHISMVKFWFIFFKQKNIQKVVSEYLAFNSGVDPNSRFGQNLNRSLKIVKKRAMIFWCTIVTNATLYSITPLFRSGRHMLDDNLIFYGLDPMLESPNYEIALSLNICAVVIITYIPLHVSCFFIILCGYIEAYMTALAKELEALWNDANKYYKEKNKYSKINDEVYDNGDLDKYISSQLDSISEAHITNINLIKKVEEVFQQYISIGFGFLMIGLIIALLGGLENTYLILPFCFIALGMDCLSGQKVMDANAIFERAVYACKWENFNPNNRKRVLLLLMNSQKTMKLSAMSVINVSLKTFMQITKTIYSIYTALRSAVNTIPN